MPAPRDRDIARAWAHLDRALGVNTSNAWKKVYFFRRRMWRRVR